MKFTKIYWDQLRKDDAFRIRNYDGTVSEEFVVTDAQPKKWRLSCEAGGDSETTMKNKRFLDMHGFCERLE